MSVVKAIVYFPVAILEVLGHVGPCFRGLLILKVSRQPHTTSRHGFVWLSHGSGLLELPTPCSAKHVLLLRIPARHGFVDLCESTGAQRPGSKALGTGSGCEHRVRTGSGLNSADSQGGLRMNPYIYIYIVS